MSRSYTRCPCENCITLAICKGKDKYIKCPLLYKYIKPDIKQRGIPYAKRSYKIRKLENIFRRKLCIYEITNLYKNNPDLILWWEPCIWWE